MTGDCVITRSSPLMERIRRGHQGGSDGGNAPFRIPATGASARALRTTLKGPCPITGRQLTLPTFEYKRRTCALEPFPSAVLEIVSYGLWPWRDGKDDISKLVRGGPFNR